MAFLSWHERYGLGHPEIDAQHRMLFEIVNHFNDVIQLGMAEELGRIVNDLYLYASEHFRFEEDLMAQIGFPDVLAHARIHDELLVQIQDLQTRMKTGGHVGTKSVARFLADWLTQHILREDLAYRPYLKG